MIFLQVAWAQAPWSAWVWMTSTITSPNSHRPVMTPPSHQVQFHFLFANFISWYFCTWIDFSGSSKKNKTPFCMHWGLFIWTGSPYNQTLMLECAKSPKVPGPSNRKLKWAWFQLSKEWSGFFLVLSIQKLYLIVSKIDLLLPHGPRYTDNNILAVSITRSTWLYGVRITRPPCISNLLC